MKFVKKIIKLLLMIALLTSCGKYNEELLNKKVVTTIEMKNGRQITIYSVVRKVSGYQFLDEGKYGVFVRRIETDKPHGNGGGINVEMSFIADGARPILLAEHHEEDIHAYFLALEVESTRKAQALGVVLQQKEKESLLIGWTSFTRNQYEIGEDTVIDKKLTSFFTDKERVKPGIKYIPEADRKIVESQ